jgi:hypothetical protein
MMAGGSVSVLGSFSPVAEFEHLVRDRLGGTVASQVVRRAPRLVCIAGDFTRYDVYAVRERRRSIDLVRYWFFGKELCGLETVASVMGRNVHRAAGRRCMGGHLSGLGRGGALAEPAVVMDEVLLGLGEGSNRVRRKQYFVQVAGQSELRTHPARPRAGGYTRAPSSPPLR